MKIKTSRLETLKHLIANKELSSQEEVLQALKEEGFQITQATLSRDLKQMKIVKTALMDGRYVYVLPNESAYKRIASAAQAGYSMPTSGFVSINFSGNMGVIKTRPGYASSIAYHIDNSDIPEIIGTIAGDDTIFMLTKEGVTYEQILLSLGMILPAVNNKA